ncbi:aminoglycoside N(3)-acetyltransferase [Streptomyces silaceus]|uniref:aminoglycoside N(3)-acetyltransferase n=1 Tax=Streptomyces silaceus TaxID=545123 RepID=UPI0006EB64EA|nr:AAC(3) family N-acetyltransferase [Streptomyces silaceus]
MPTPPPTGPLCTRASLAAELLELGVRPGETLLVHTSLSALGWVSGGAVALVQALLDALGPDGTLVVPTHTGDNSEPSVWRDPPVPESWWPVLRATMPAYDPLTSPSFGVGVVPEAVRTWPGALRSAHPQASFAALGPAAATITAGHARGSSFGERSPLAHLEKAGARVLLLGAGYDSCTAFHLAQYRVPGPETENSFAAMTSRGREWRTVREPATPSDRFGELGAAFERDTEVVRGLVGAAESRLFPLADAVAYAEQWLPAHAPRPEP